MTRTLLILLVVAAAATVGCSGETSESAKTHRVAADRASHNVVRFLTLSLQLLETTTIRDADEYLSAAHGCARRGTTLGRQVFHSCTTAAGAGTEMMDGPALHDPLVAWRIADQDLGDVFSAVLDSLVSGKCRTAIAADENLAGNAYDRLIGKVEAAAAAGRFDLVASLTTPPRIKALDVASTRAHRDWTTACR
jgi:hypothetical protein